VSRRRSAMAGQWISVGMMTAVRFASLTSGWLKSGQQYDRRDQAVGYKAASHTDFEVRGAAGAHLTARQLDRFLWLRCDLEETLKAATVVGILLIVVGIIGFIAGGVSFTHEKKDVDMGPVQIQHKQTKTVPISPILSAVALVGGIGLVVVGARS